MLTTRSGTGTGSNGGALARGGEALEARRQRSRAQRLPPFVARVEPCAAVGARPPSTLVPSSSAGRLSRAMVNSDAMVPPNGLRK